MNARVLLVDDEPNVLEGLKRQLRKRVEVETATSGRAGLEVIRKSPPFAVVVSDMRMPEMNGSAFLEKARVLSPDTTRMILSGQAEIESTIAAVNSGQIFRFLTKPCSPEELVAALNAGIEQYNLIIAKRELLEKTLHGTVQVLTEILGLTNPAAQSRTNRIAGHVREIAKTLGIASTWQLELATMLSQVGCITLPEEILTRLCVGQPLAADALSIYRSHPQLAGKLIGSIPRLETVADVISHQLDDIDFAALQGEPKDWPLERSGPMLLRIATELDNALSSGASGRDAIQRVIKALPGLPEHVAAALKGLNFSAGSGERISVRVAGLQVGMVLDEDLMSLNGMRLVPKGQEITRSLLIRLQSIAEGIGVAEPFRVKIVR